MLNVAEKTPLPMTSVLLGMALSACLLGGNVFAHDTQTAHAAKAEYAKPGAQSQQSNVTLPAVTVKATQDSTNIVRPHSTFNPQGERCIDRMLPFVGAGFQR